MMRPILASDMPSTVSPSPAGCHGPMVGVQTPVGQQIYLRVEQLPIHLIQRQATPTAITEDIQYRFGVLPGSVGALPRRRPLRTVRATRRGIRLKQAPRA